MDSFFFSVSLCGGGAEGGVVQGSAATEIQTQDPYMLDKHSIARITASSSPIFEF